MKITKYLFLFILTTLLFSGVFACHVYTTEAAIFIHDFSDSCPDEEEISISQNKIQNGQKFILDFNSAVSEKLSDLVQEIDTNLISLENLDNSQTDQLLTIAKIE